MKSIGFTSLKQRLSRAMAPDLRHDDWIELFFLSLAVGAYVLLALISAYLPGGTTEHEETQIYVLGWTLAPVGAVLSVPLLVWACRKHLARIPNAPSILLLVNALLFECLASGLNLYWQSTKSVSLIPFLTHTAIVLIPLINFIAFLALKASKTIGPVSIWVPLAVGSVGILNFVGLFPYFSGQYDTPLYLLGLSIHVGFAALIIKRPNLPVQNRFLLLAIDVVVIFLIACACFDPTFSIEQGHQDFYLGPVNRLLHGGTMLVDAFSLYGVLVIYSLAFLVRTGLLPLTYQGLSLAIAVLMTIQFSAIYLLLIVLMKDRFYAILLLVLTLLLGVFGSLGIVQAYPSTGPLRFGLAYLVLAAVFLRRRFPRLRRAGLIVEYLLVGIASLWSFETFVYVGFSYLGICLYESLGGFAGFREILAIFIRRLSWLFATIATFHALLALGTYARAQAWPNWGIYFDFVKSYSVRGLTAVPIEPWSPWIFPTAIYFVSLMVFVFRYLFLKSLAESEESELIFGLTLFGIAQYTYFLGRSHPNNLYHISSPAVIIAGYWFAQLNSQRALPASFRRVIKLAFYSAAALIISTTLPSFLIKYQQHHTGYRIVLRNLHSIVIGRSLDLDRRWARLRDSYIGGSPPPIVSDSVALLRKYTPGEADAAIFIPAQYITETLILAGREHRFPINDPQEDYLSEGITNRILAYRHDLQGNDVVVVADYATFVSDRASGSWPSTNVLMIGLIDRLCEQFAFEEVETTPSGVVAVRLGKSEGAPTEYCVKMKSLDTP
jgi:hypothetical protein